jgi:arabinosaccharide transport system substrate-binding protein
VTQDTDGDGETDIYMTSTEMTDVFTFRALALMLGGGAYNAEGELILNSPANAQALQMIQDMVHVDGIMEPAPGGGHHQADYYLAWNDGKIASVWMPQWYMERYPREMSTLEGKVVVRPMPIFEEGGFTTTMGGGTGTAITNQIDPAKIGLATEFLAFAKLSYEGQVELWTELGFDPFRLDVYDDERLSQPNPFWSGEVPFEYIKAELGNVAPEYTGALFPEIATIIRTTLMYNVVENKMDPAEALAAAEAELMAMSG